MKKPATKPTDTGTVSPMMRDALAALRERGEIGRTVGDARRLLQHCPEVMLAVRVGLEPRDSHRFLRIGRAVFLRAIQHIGNGDAMPCEAWPDGTLVVGTAAAIAVAEAGR